MIKALLNVGDTLVEYSNERAESFQYSDGICDLYDKDHKYIGIIKSDYIVYIGDSKNAMLEIKE